MGAHGSELVAWLHFILGTADADAWWRLSQLCQSIFFVTAVTIIY